eukprot:scaffold247_cov274-Pinguiococcus_pyrenoidosus.AAC.7
MSDSRLGWQKYRRFVQERHIRRRLDRVDELLPGIERRQQAVLTSVHVCDRRDPNHEPLARQPMGIVRQDSPQELVQQIGHVMHRSPHPPARQRQRQRLRLRLRGSRQRLHPQTQRPQIQEKRRGVKACNSLTHLETCAQILPSSLSSSSGGTSQAKAAARTAPQPCPANVKPAFHSWRPKARRSASQAPK